MRALLLVLVLPALIQAQTVTVSEVLLGEVLMREVETEGLAALAIDPVERAIVAGTWTPPVTSQPDPDGVVWQPLAAGDDGWIRDHRLQRAYAYATIEVEQDGVWLLEAMGYRGVYVNGELRVGNVYGYTDEWQPWQPAFDWARVPVRLRAGANELLFFGSRYGLLRARLVPVAPTLRFNPDDVTLPDLVTGQPARTHASIVVINTTDAVVTDAGIEATLDGGEPRLTALPPLPPMGVRKVGFAIAGPTSALGTDRELTLNLVRGAATIDTTRLALAVKGPDENRRVTFVSEIDGSVQYYGYLPPQKPPTTVPEPDALVLSLHGAAVEAINQSGSYAPLTWAHLVAPTNRRPFGFNWEDWGRLDALEVLDRVQNRHGIARDRVYLTGHSMGGHGSWHLATLEPDRFAAVGPSAGWVSFWSYRPDREDADASPLARMLERATLPSRTLTMAPNLAGLGVYVLHGQDDQVVSVEEARAMRDRLAEFHRDVDWHEQPGAGHWWDLSDAPGADCVAWAPMFDFFARHRRPDSREVRRVRFRTPNPAVTAHRAWVTVSRQVRPYELSEVDLAFDPVARTLAGSTVNVQQLLIRQSGAFTAVLDGDTLSVPDRALDPVVLTRDGSWRVGGEAFDDRRGLRRGGGFREVFGRRVQLVYGTQGTPEETAWARARARHDAEHLWYQGNASLDVLPDTLYDAAADPDRNVILYGNADTHAHWSALWSGTDLQVARGRLAIGERTLEGDGLGLLAIRPREGSRRASVGIVAGTGLPGLRLTDRRPFLAPGVAYPDVTVFQDLGDGTAVRSAGFLGNDWSLAGGEFVWAEVD
jgi:poly(3-hydroxybutyrate) depolymerase